MTYTPSQLNQYIKGRMDSDPILSKILVRGELSNYKFYPSGHHYFSLKDGEGAIRCVLFRGNAAGLRFRPENGMQGDCVRAGQRISQGRTVSALLLRPHPRRGGRPPCGL